MQNGESKERLVVVETKLDHIEHVQSRTDNEVKELEKSSLLSFAQLKESTVNLRVSVEVIAATLEGQSNRLTAVENTLKDVSQRVDSHDVKFVELTNKVGIHWIRFSSYVAGASLTLTLLWGLGGGYVTDFAKKTLSAVAQSQTVP